MSGIINKLFGWNNKKEKAEKTIDKIERTQNTLKTGKKAEPAESIQPSHTKNTIEPKKLEKVPPQPTDAKNRVVRVFVSSTFRDMVEDRNELMSQVWPALRKTCRARAVEFVEVDLRWGVTEEQTQGNETLRLCLAEIKRCRPYFIGMLGERYGWVPGLEAYSPAVLEEESWLRSEVAKRSVTELEILHGVLNDPDMARRTFFYFRDPKYAQVRGCDFKAENDADKDRQIALKQQVKSVCEAKHIPLREEYADPCALAALVLADLTAAINSEFPPDQVPDVWMREERDHEAYAKSRRTEFYVGRDAYFDRLNAFARNGAQGCGMTVLGESGGGKSALLSNWVARWRQANPEDFIFQHYIGSSPMSASHLALMRRLMVYIVRWCSDEEATGSRSLEEEKIPAQAEEIVKVFPEYLDRLVVRAKQKGVRAVLVLDALNQLEDRERGRLLAWLPHRMPQDVHLVVSTLQGDTLNALQPRGWLTLKVEPLTHEERVQLIERYLSHFSQALSEARAGKIVGVSASTNPLYIKTLLDDLRATGSHDRLDVQIADYLQAPDIPSLFGKILKRYERDYERDRPGLVREAMALLWAARRGLTEPELLQVLKPEGYERMSAALWSPIRCALEDGLVDKDGVLAFAHQHLLDAVELRYVPDERTARKLRSRLADHFAAQPVDSRQADELPWLLWKIEAHDHLRACLLDIDRFLIIQERDENELLGYWLWLKEERTMGQPYTQAFQRWEKDRGVPAEVVVYTANQVSNFLMNAALYADAEPLYRRSLEISERILGTEHPSTLASLTNLATLLHQKGDYEGAEPIYRLSMETCERVFGREHQSTLVSLNNLAMLLYQKGDYEGAEPLHRLSMEICERVHGKDHPNTLRSMVNFAGLLESKGDYKGAEPLYRRALETCEQVLGEEHPQTLASLNNLAKLLTSKGDYEESELLYRRALDGRERVLGKEHPNTFTSMNNVATMLQRKGDNEGAERLYRSVLEGRKRVLGKEHPNTILSAINLAGLLESKGDYKGAEQLCRYAVDAYEQVLGKEHPDTLRCMNALAEMLMSKGDYKGAEQLCRNAVETCDRVLGEEHPQTLASLNHLAILLRIKGDYKGAESLYRRALDAYENVLGKEHPDTLTSMNNLAELLHDKGDYEGAEPLHRLSMETCERVLGKEHPQTLASLNNLATLLRIKGDYKGAESLYRRALAAYERVLGKEHPDTLTSMNNLAELLHDKGDYEGAEPLYCSALEGICKISRNMGVTHPNLKIIVNNYANCLRKMGKDEVQIRQKIEAVLKPYGMGI